MSIVSSLILGIVLAAVAVNHHMLMLLLLLGLSGALLTISNVSANSFLQLIATNDTRGRMASLYQLSVHGGLSLGALFTGYMSTRIGISHALLVNAAAAILLQLFVLAFPSRAIRSSM